MASLSDTKWAEKLSSITGPGRKPLSEAEATTIRMCSRTELTSWLKNETSWPLQVKAIRVWAEVEGRSLEPSDVDWFLVNVYTGMPEFEGRDDAFRLFCDRGWLKLDYCAWKLIGDGSWDDACVARLMQDWNPLEPSPAPEFMGAGPDLVGSTLLLTATQSALRRGGVKPCLDRVLCPDLRRIVLCYALPAAPKRFTSWLLPPA